MADFDVIRHRIITSVFTKRNATEGLEETYAGHVKIWEAVPEGGGKKPRYILLSRTSNGGGLIHKAKLNTNGTFSVGKTWRLEELRSVQVVNPLAFNITLSRTYRWQTENEFHQYNFIVDLVHLFRTVTGGAVPLQLEGLLNPNPTSGSRNELQSDQLPTQELPRTPPPTARTLDRRQATQLSQTPSQSEQDPLSPGRLQLRHASPGSAADGNQSSSSRARSQTPTQPLASSSSSTPSTRRERRPSQSTSTTNSVLSPDPPISPPQMSSRPSKENVQSTPVRTGVEIPTSHFTSPPSALSTYSPIAAYPPHVTALRSSIPPENLTPVSRVHTSESQGREPDYNARISFFDPASRATLEQLINKGGEGGEDESVAISMANVEEMLEGYEWASDDVISGKGGREGRAADLIEARLLDELMALEKANIHSFLVSDNRVAVVCKYIDEAISELDDTDSLISSYKIHLNAVGEDISYIQSQNRGLQVQTQNQRALLNELENLLKTVHVDKDALAMLTQESLEKTRSIQRLEDAATELYKALQAGRDTDMAATMERLDEYRTHNAQFCKRMFDFLSIMFTAQSKLLLGDGDGITVSNGQNRVTVLSHLEMETYLGRYSGLMLYLKEMDENVYAKLCAAYFSAANGLHDRQINALFAAYLGMIKKASSDEQDQGFSANPLRSGSAVRRTGTLVKSPTDGRKERDKAIEGELRASEALSGVLEQTASLIYREDDFVTQFLHINDAAYTFAEYMRLDNYFRRQAARGAVLSPPTTRLIRGGMELIFGFLPTVLKTWLDNALTKDSMEIIGIIATLERFLFDSDDRANTFLQSVIEKQHIRLKGLFERHVAEQIKFVEQTKLASKKRQGIAHFIKHFPVYLTRVEHQLIGAEDLDIRVQVDGAYEKIVHSMFDSLVQLAKMSGEGENKGQLYYHVILIENMRFFSAEMSQIEVGPVSDFLRRAEDVYQENLTAYVKLVLHRPFSKLIDYFEGIERLTGTTAPTEVSKDSNYNKSALKKVVKEFTSKDIRKHIDGLFKRVEKHFVDTSEKPTTEDTRGVAPETVIAGVMKACEEELLGMTDLFNKRISQCYADTGIILEYTIFDVEAAFRRHQ